MDHIKSPFAVTAAFAAATAVAFVPTIARAQEPTPTPATTPTLEASVPAGGAVYIEAESTRPDASLFRLSQGRRGLDGNLSGSLSVQLQKEKVCGLPCRLSVAPGTFAVGGPGLRQSPMFELTGANPRVKVTANPGTENALIGGIVLGGAGALATTAGLGMLLVSSLPLEDENGMRVDTGGLGIAGLVVLAVGVGAGIAGLSMAMGSSTKIDVAPMR